MDLDDIIAKLNIKLEEVTEDLETLTEYENLDELTIDECIDRLVGLGCDSDPVKLLGHNFVVRIDEISSFKIAEGNVVFEVNLIDGRMEAYELEIEYKTTKGFLAKGALVDMLKDRLVNNIYIQSIIKKYEE